MSHLCPKPQTPSRGAEAVDVMPIIPIDYFAVLAHASDLALACSTFATPPTHT